MKDEASKAGVPAPILGLAASKASPSEADGGDRAEIAALASWARQELTGNILPYWQRRGRDPEGEGFLGEITADDAPVAEADRSIVMVARHLWTFSSAATFLADPSLLGMADEAYRYLLGRFRDRERGGFFWTVKRDGGPSIDKKQVYGQAFAMYALAEYARIPYLRDEVRGEALSFALACFDLFERHARDRLHGGYVEALAADWSEAADRSLSPIDIDCDKSMNTNLHVLEALTNLYRVSGAPAVREAILSLLEVHSRRILQDDGHLGLFFRSDWSRMDRRVSYGHDIEASWLMEEAVAVLAAHPVAGRGVAAGTESEAGPEERILDAVRNASAALAESALREGIDPVSGALEEEAESSEPGAARSRRRIWWCQAEAMVGFFAAWQRSGGRRFLDASLGVRRYVERAIVDRDGGEWYWGTDESDRPIAGFPKGGNWKTGYHDGRACMELMRRAARYL